MKLSQPFIRLPFRFDVERLAEEVRALPSTAWKRHPSGFGGNTAARLITVDGQESDDFIGVMAPTPHLQHSPYLQQVLASFGTVWSRSRLMKLTPGATVPEHSDVNYHWFQRVRLHIPILTQPGVRFRCGDQAIHMAAGEAWIFDNWRLHSVENASDQERVHLVADTTGSANFWAIVASGLRGEAARLLPYQPGAKANLLLERYNHFQVMHPAEVDVLLGDLLADVVATDSAIPGALGQFSSLINGFRADWRQLWALHGESGAPHFGRLLTGTLERARQLAAGLRTRSNDLPARTVLEARLEFAVGTRQRERSAVAATDI